MLVHPSLIDWGWMRQRPHHLATQFARSGYLVFFCPPQTRTDFVRSFTRVDERLYLCGCIDWLYELPDAIVLVSKPQDGDVAERFTRPTIIYDCLDDLAVHSRTGRVSQRLQRQHEHLLQAASVVCATADRIHRDVLRSRSDALLCPNAVDFERFQSADVPPPTDLEPIVRQGRPIIGYYGALAQWFDFDVLRAVAKGCPQYSFVLIGPDYDGTLGAALERQPANVHWLGEKSYDDLPAYLHHFAVATIPFRVNEITLATSPLKLFEYMAAGKPVVTTALPECQAFAEVHTANDGVGFVAALEAAMAEGQDAAFRARVREIARRNSWEERVRLIEQHLGQLAGGAS